MQVQSLGGEESLEEKMATHYSILAWRIPWTDFFIKKKTLHLLFKVIVFSVNKF